MNYSVGNNVLSFGAKNSNVNYQVEHNLVRQMFEMDVKQTEPKARTRKTVKPKAQTATVWERVYAKKVAEGWWPKRVTRQFIVAFAEQRAKYARRSSGSKRCPFQK